MNVSDDNKQSSVLGKRQAAKRGALREDAAKKPKLSSQNGLVKSRAFLAPPVSMRQEQRREWNKANARKSRLRKKFMGETLLTRVDLLRDQNDIIKGALAQRGLLAAFATWSAAGGHAADLVPADDAMRRTGEDSMAYRRIMSALDSVRDAKHDYDSSGDTALVAVPAANKKAVHVVPHTAVVLVQPAGAASTTSGAPDSAQGSSVLTGGGAGTRAAASGPSRGRVLASVSTAPSSGGAQTDGGTGTSSGTGSEEAYNATGAAAMPAPPVVHANRPPAPFRAPSGPVLMLVPSPRADHARKASGPGAAGGKSNHFQYDLEELEDDEYEEDGMDDEDDEDDDDELYGRRTGARGGGSMGEGVYPGQLQGRRPAEPRHAQDSSPDQDGPEEDEMISDDDRELISKARTDAEHEGSISSFLTATTTRTSSGGPRQQPSAMVRLCPQDYELMQLVASAQQHFIIADATVADNPIAFASQGFHTLTGYSRDEILGFNCRFLQGPGSDPSTVARIRAAVSTGRDVRAVILNYTKAGQPFWNELFIAPLKDSSGKSVHFVGVQKAIPAEQARRLLAAEALAREHEGQGEQGALQKATGYPAIRDSPDRAAAAAKASVALASRSSAMRAPPGIAVQVKR